MKLFFEMWTKKGLDRRNGTVGGTELVLTGGVDYDGIARLSHLVFLFLRENDCPKMDHNMRIRGGWAMATIEGVRYSICGNCLKILRYVSAAGWFCPGRRGKAARVLCSSARFEWLQDHPESFAMKRNRIMVVNWRGGCYIWLCLWIFGG